MVAVYWAVEFGAHIGLGGHTKAFAVFYAAARAVLHGRDPYSDPLMYSPPWVPVWMVPFALLPLQMAQVLWNLLGVLVVVLSGVLVYRLRFTPGTRIPGTALILAVLAVMVFYPLRQNFDSVQSDVWPLLATVLFVYLDARGRPFLAGLALLPGLVDPHLLIGPCLYALVQRRWWTILGGATAGAAAVLTALAAQGPRFLRAYPARLHLAESQKIFGSHQVTVVHTLVAAGVAPGAAFVLYALVAGASLVLGALAFTRGGRDPWRDLAICAAVSGLVAPFAFAYDYTLLLLALPFVIDRIQHRLPAAGMAVVFGFSIYCGGVSWIRYPFSHDLLHAVMPLLLFPLLRWLGVELGLEGKTLRRVLVAWIVSDVVFGLANPALPLWADALAFPLGAACILWAAVVAARPGGAPRAAA